MEYSKEFHKYIYWLGDSVPEYMQKEAINFLVKCREDYIPYIICTANAFTWNNAIEVLKEIGYPKNKTATNSILYLFQDINWPCSSTAMNVLKEIYEHEPNLVIKSIEEITKVADHHNDTQWLFGLSYVKEVLGISKSAFKDKKTIVYLQKGEFWDNNGEIT